MNIVEIGRLPDPRVVLEKRATLAAIGRGAKAIAPFIPGAVAGGALSTAENKYAPWMEGVSPVWKGLNVALGTTVGAAGGSALRRASAANPAHAAAGAEALEKTVASLAMKSLGVKGIAHTLQRADKYVDMQESLAQKGLDAAESQERGGKAVAIAAGTIVAGIVGAMGYDYWKMRRQEKKRTGMIRVTLPTSRQDAESKVDIPLAALPEETYKGVLRDTRRRLRSEVEERKMRRGQAAAALRDGAEVINRMSEPVPAKG